MAIVTLGPMAGQVSGRIGSVIFSHNRGGTYTRNGTIPSNPQTTYQQEIRAYLAAASQNWRNLTEAQRLAWEEYSLVLPWTNRLGKSITLNGQQAYNQLATILVAIGSALPTTPPLGLPPDPIGGLALSADIGAGNFEATWTSGALPAGVGMLVEACIVPRATINFRKNLYRVITYAPPAQTSPLDLETEFTARFGSLQVGQIAHIRCATIDTTTGLRASRMVASATVVST